MVQAMSRDEEEEETIYLFLFLFPKIYGSFIAGNRQINGNNKLKAPFVADQNLEKEREREMDGYERRERERERGTQ